jgi:hypothetical protein
MEFPEVKPRFTPTKCALWVAATVACTSSTMFVEHMLIAHGKETGSGLDFILAMIAIITATVSWFYLSGSLSRALPQLFFGALSEQVFDKSKALVDFSGTEQMYLRSRSAIFSFATVLAVLAMSYTMLYLLDQLSILSM